MNFEFFIQIIVNGLMIGCIYALSALGLTLIWGVMEIVNFAHGNFFMLAMYASFWMFTLLKIDPLFGLPIVFILFFLLGTLFYRAVVTIVFKSSSSFSQILATNATGIIIMALAIYFWSSDYRTIRGNILQGSYHLGEVFIGIPQFYTSVICLLCMAALSLFLNRTKMGRAIKATSINKEAAELVGINIEFIYQLVVSLGIALVGISGSLVSNFYYIHPATGMTFGILAFVVVAIGGFGSVQGALYGGLLLGLVTSFSGIFATTYKYAIAYSMYLIVMYFKPKGLKGW